MEIKKLKDQQISFFSYLGCSLYLAFWGFIVFFMKFYQDHSGDDYLEKVVNTLTMILGVTKVITCILCLLLFSGMQGKFFLTLSQFVIFITRLLDAIPLAFLGYKGIWLHDPMAFMLFLPKAGDSILLYVITGSNGVVKPCFFCFDPKNSKFKDEDTEDEEVHLSGR